MNWYVSRYIKIPKTTKGLTFKKGWSEMMILFKIKSVPVHCHITLARYDTRICKPWDDGFWTIMLWFDEIDTFL